MKIRIPDLGATELDLSRVSSVQRPSPEQVTSKPSQASGHLATAHVSSVSPSHSSKLVSKDDE